MMNQLSRLSPEAPGPPGAMVPNCTAVKHLQHLFISARGQISQTTDRS